ncbi:MAG: peptidyl-prolyl cis-trans isomerase [Waddliaceae bacterium]
MKKLILCLTLLSFQSLAAANAPAMNPWSDSKPHILINNRILAQVNGKPITVMDVVKKMDMHFYQRFPQYSSFEDARYQFYMANWKPILKELIEKELILEDAKQMKVNASTGEVRKELEKLFGPHIIDNLEKAGLTYADAIKMIKDDMILKKIIGFRVNARAVRQITPLMLWNEYQEFAEKNISPAQWTYHVITVNNENGDFAERSAKNLYNELVTANVSFETLNSWIESSKGQFGSSTISLSSALTQNENELSDNYRPILTTLQPRTFSPPTEHESRTRQSKVYRIFYISDYNAGGAPTFEEVEIKLKERLIGKAVEKETKEYLQKLRTHHEISEDVDSLYPSEFQPFFLKN